MIRTSGRMSLARRLMPLAIGLALLPGLAHAADHRDGPRITDLNNTPAGALDLNDLFIFQGANRNNTVLIQTMSPGAGVVGPGVFFSPAFYDLLISNDGEPLDADEIIFRSEFSGADPSGRQTFRLSRSDNGGAFVGVAQGTTNGRPVNIRGGGRATAGIFDDPFFFDVNATARLNREVTLIGLARAGQLMFRPSASPTAPVLTALPADIDTNRDGTADLVNAGARQLLPPNFPQDFFGGANTLAIIIEIPRFRIQSSRSNPNITAHIRSIADIGDGRGLAQFDRTALPSLNTVITPLTRTFNGELLANGFQDQFNFRTPQGDGTPGSSDVDLRPVAIDRLMTIFGRTPAEAAGLAAVFLPDVARFNTTSPRGFLNGRQLADDVIDAEIQLLTANGLTGDRVNGSSFYRRNFPYIQVPNPVSQVLARSLRARMSAEGE